MRNSLREILSRCQCPFEVLLLAAIAVVVCLVMSAQVWGEQPPLGTSIPVKVIHVQDGVTLTVTYTMTCRVRLLDCWSPELRQPGGTEAKANLVRLAEGREGVLFVPHQDKLGKRFSFDRVLAELWIDGRNVSDVQVEEGYATETKRK